MFKHPPQKELKERAVASRCNRRSHGGAGEVSPPVTKRMEESKAEAGAHGKLWRSTRGRRPEAIWGLLVFFHQCGALLLHHPGIQRRMHYPKQPSEGRFWVMDKPTSYPPACERDRRLPAVLPLHPPAWQPFPCNSTIPIQGTSESCTDS